MLTSSLILLLLLVIFTLFVPPRISFLALSIVVFFPLLITSFIFCNFYRHMGDYLREMDTDESNTVRCVGEPFSFKLCMFVFDFADVVYYKLKNV